MTWTPKPILDVDDGDTNDDDDTNPRIPSRAAVLPIKIQEYSIIMEMGTKMDRHLTLFDGAN